ncbi:serologically defined colon cancer antigen 8 homolog isoform X1 [Tribolium castaneum]|uniref:serologically defined colon cancer antigen 8 homolog isoform X1 n=1 Tax=Tribolium castaneum TaxID=7070 RepID=UPI00077D9D25|nr:PREDICTED: serologically defined colon cancer antigen 8 homolog isoform X1 [Tribolium castaneum]|eukprot:XP_015833755.1 PREDICTED: serologically defined colon cancer antigen 8 homolog isoform X1 [Tribolium castaneum]
MSYTMYNTPTSKKQKPTTSYLVRPRLGAIRSIYSTKPMSSYSQDKKKKLKKSLGKMEYKKKPDYADTAYREAVGRLRILLAESYTPIKRPLRELDSAGEDTDNQSLISATSRTSKGYRPYYQYLTMPPKRYHYYPSIRPTSVLPPETEKNVMFCRNAPKFEGSSAPPELMSFIEKQEEYIEQLEKESRFCRDELSCLLSKVKDVISENENLHEKQKSNLMKSVFSHLETETETETDVDLAQKMSLSPKKSKKTRVLEGPTIVFESRISELEAQLTQAKIDLRKALEDNDNYKKKIADGTIFDGFGFEHYKKQIDALQREKDVLQETISKLQAALAKVRDKENVTCDQVKRSLDVAEQAQYEKNAAELEIRRLKDELERQHSKLRDAISDQSRRISDERSAVERRYTQQIEQLTAELGVQWETTNKLQLELDKQRRENADLRREIAQKEALLDGMRKDMQNKIMTLQSDIGVNGAEKSALEQQIATLQMTNERNERQSKQEIGRLQAEMQSLRQRLDRADADLIHSRRENIRLTEQVASLEKEIKLNSALSEEKSKQSSGEVLALPPPKEQDKQLSSLIQDMESKHAATVAELEGMIHSQNQLMDKLSVECHTLTQKLEDASARHKEEIRELQTSLSRLNSRLLNQSQITSSRVKDEDYNSPSNQRTAPPKILSRSNSRSSVKPNPTLSRNNSEDKTPSLQNISDNRTYGSDQPHVGDASDERNYIPEDYQTDPNKEYDQYGNDPNQQYQMDPNQQYATDPNQQYEMNPNAQYDESYGQYLNDPNVQYVEDPNQQYEMNPEQQEYVTDPNHPDQQYGTNQQQQEYVTDPNHPDQQYGTNQQQQEYVTNPNHPDQQYDEGSSNVQYSNDPNQYSDPQQQYQQQQKPM